MWPRGCTFLSVCSRKRSAKGAVLSAPSIDAPSRLIQHRAHSIRFPVGTSPPRLHTSSSSPLGDDHFKPHRAFFQHAPCSPLGHNGLLKYHLLPLPRALPSDKYQGMPPRYVKNFRFASVSHVNGAPLRSGRDTPRSRVLILQRWHGVWVIHAVGESTCLFRANDNCGGTPAGPPMLSRRRPCNSGHASMFPGSVDLGSRTIIH